MRVTSTTYSSLVQTSSQSAQQQLAVIQQQISSGDSVQFASDDPLVFQQASQTQSSLAQLNAYTSAASTATTQTAENNQAMTSLHKLIAQAGEYATGVTSNMTTSEVQDVGQEMSALVSQITNIANSKDSNGNYLFGGTSNAAPIDATTGTYSASTNGATTSVDVQQGFSVQTGILAGRPGSPATSGFLYDASTGVDVLGAVQQAVTDLQAGNATAVQNTDLPALNKALDLVSSYVGSTAASMAAVQSASTTLAAQTTAQTNTLNALTQTNLPTDTLQLQQIQTQYQASLEAGSRILGLSILNYLPAA